MMLNLFSARPLFSALVLLCTIHFVAVSTLLPDDEGTRGNLIDLVDWRLDSHFDKEEVLALMKVALMCTNAIPALKPPMSSVVSMLEGKVVVPVLDSEGTIMTEEKIEAMRKHFRGGKHQAAGENITKSMSTEGPWTGTASSTSGNDICLILLNTDF